jgi:hypothetical protein
MITILIAGMLAGADPSATYIRNFMECLRDVDSEARSQKVAPDGFDAFARQHCANVETPYKASIVTEDVSHGMSRKEAVSDAASVIESYYSERRDNYQAFYKRSQSASADAPAAPPKVTPPPTPAAQPK